MAYNSAYTGAQIDAAVGVVNQLIDKIYPVGSIYMSVNATNPATFIGGTWARITDVFLLASGNAYAPGSTGGEAVHTLTTNEMPAHEHKSYYYWSSGSNVGGNWKITMTNTTTGGVGTWPNHSGLTNVALTGGGGRITICLRTLRSTSGKEQRKFRKEVL